MPIYITGFMCSGKTRVGEALARKLKRPWYDVDRVAEERVGALLPFIQREGETAFRKVEAVVLKELSSVDRAVVSTGGGTVLDDGNRAVMKASGTTVLLDVPLPVLLERIAAKGGDRPLLFGLKGEALRTRVAALMEERSPFYRMADMVVPAEGHWEQVAERLAERFTDHDR
jgi:shikimate kinase